MAWSARVSAAAQSPEQTMRGTVGDWMQSLHNARPQYAQTATASAALCLKHFMVCRHADTSLDQHAESEVRPDAQLRR
jgi:hypothetical protein